MVSSNQQRVVWEFISELKKDTVDKANSVGPYRVTEGSLVERFGGCSSYDACLDFAAARRWGGFTCKGCYRFEIQSKGGKK